MANIVITSDAIQVHVDFGGYAAQAHIHDTSFKRSDISKVEVPESDDYISVVMSNGDSFDISHNGTSGAMTVDSVDSVAPTSNLDLRDKINALVL